MYPPEGNRGAARPIYVDEFPSIAVHAFVGAVCGYLLVEIAAGLVTGLVIGPIREDLALREFSGLYRLHEFALWLVPVAGVVLGFGCWRAKESGT